MPPPTPAPPGTRRLTVRSGDGVRLAGIVVPAAVAPAGAPAAARPITWVVAHGFTNSVTRPGFLRMAGWLSRFGEVRAVDFRGHGRSGGGSTAGGDPEMHDLDASVAAARADAAGDGGAVDGGAVDGGDGPAGRAVVTLGLSMGGGAALRQAALGKHRPDAVVSLSAVSRWYVRDTRPMQRVHWLLETTPGRRLAARALGLRLDPPWVVPPAPPLQVVSGIAPTPLLLVHGDRDEYFPLEHFRTLAQAAGPTATAWVVPGFGHAESGATRPLVERIGHWVSATIGR